MPLETLSNTGDKDIAISSLCIDVPVRQYNVHFDPVRDLTEEDWAGMVEAFRGQHDPRDAYEMCAAMKLLGGDMRRWEENPLIAQHFFSTRLERHQDYVASATNYAIFHPGAWKAYKEGIQVPEVHRWVTDWQGWLRERQDDEAVRATFWRGALCLKVCFPEKFPYLVLSEEDWVREERDAQQYRSASDAEFFTWVKICFPSQFAARPAFNDVDWDGMHRELDSWRCRALSRVREIYFWRRFTCFARDMLILAAHEVKVTERSLEIVLRKPCALGEDVPPLPQLRSF